MDKINLRPVTYVLISGLFLFYYFVKAGCNGEQVGVQNLSDTVPLYNGNKENISTPVATKYCGWAYFELPLIMLDPNANCHQILRLGLF